MVITTIMVMHTPKKISMLGCFKLSIGEVKSANTDWSKINIFTTMPTKSIMIALIYSY